MSSFGWDKRWVHVLSEHNGVRTFDYYPLGEKKKCQVTTYDINGLGTLDFIQYYWKPFLRRRRLYDGAIGLTPETMYRAVDDAAKGKFGKGMYHTESSYNCHTLTIMTDVYSDVDLKEREKQYCETLKCSIALNCIFTWLFREGEPATKDFNHLFKVSFWKHGDGHDISRAEFMNENLLDELRYAEKRHYRYLTFH